MLSQKNSTTTVQQKSLRVREKERFKRLIFKQLEKGMQLEWGLLLSFAVFLSPTKACMHTQIFGVSGNSHYAQRVEGKTLLPHSGQEMGESVTSAGCTKL